MRRKFIGRDYEIGLLSDEKKKAVDRASLIVVYGRRRVGKTRLITEFYRDNNLWKFDGIENDGKQGQIKNILDQLSIYTGDVYYKSVLCTSWIDLLRLLDRALASTKNRYNAAVLLDELSYMASREQELVAALKWAWDNLWQDKKGFTLILCGSVASFMVNKVLKSSSLYGRINLEICLRPLSLPEVWDFFGRRKSIKEICNLYMFCGGVPEYLNQIDPAKSVSENIVELALTREGYFIHEFDRIFKDIFREEQIYKKIILVLSKNKNLKVPEMTNLLKVSKGGGFIECLENLELAGFIKEMSPFDRPQESKLKRYRLEDEYLHFYFKFIFPNLDKIQEVSGSSFAHTLLTGASYKSWAGFAFERLCLKHVNFIIRYLGIDQLVKDYGPYYNRMSNTKEGVQIDLMMVRHDPVVTICEMKYYDGLVGKWIMNEMEKKVELLGETKKTIEKVLITTEGITKDLADSNYFSRTILIDELFKKAQQ